MSKVLFEYEKPAPYGALMLCTYDKGRPLGDFDALLVHTDLESLQTCVQHISYIFKEKEVDGNITSKALCQASCQ